ncbi:hypothetical protein [Anianabacter salinae]|uniref:hypothetical protein n=1 Tax=Anianabacter salinae TaxID=2851023 RepID=UPI00225DE371|nr:hypothetical protein [Anianabacter salinae]MBV0912560.1 hypothetical protein [Anianabacter salinae]
MIRLAALSLVLAAPAAAVSPIAEIVCAPRADMVDRLTRSYGATKNGVGLDGPERIVEMWTDRRGDWTLVMTYPDGRACIVAMGEGWETLADSPA